MNNSNINCDKLHAAEKLTPEQLELLIAFLDKIKQPDD